MWSSVVFFLGVLASGLASECDVMSPIVIVPGILGNALEAQLHKANHTPHWFCPKDKDWFTLWLSLSSLLVGEIDCFTDNAMLHYNATTKTYSNTEGVSTRVPGFGNTSSIEYLDPSATDLEVTQYFHAMVQHFVDKGYVRGKTIVGAPYDWRYAPDEFLKQNYYAELKQLIEKTYNNSGNKKIVLLVHSMGAPVSLFFLTKLVDQAWKEKYLKAYVSVSGVWRGAANAAKAFVSGENEDIVVDLPIWARASQRSYPSTALLLPYPSDTWTDKDVLFITPQRNYTAWDYKALFNDIGYPKGYDMFLATKDLAAPMIPPNITTYCYYGCDYPTPQQFKYTAGEFPDIEPIVYNGNGDGTVNIQSLLACSLWKDKMPFNLTMQGFPNVEHVDTIKNIGVIQHVDDVVCNVKE